MPTAFEITLWLTPSFSKRSESASAIAAGELKQFCLFIFALLHNYAYAFNGIKKRIIHVIEISKTIKTNMMRYTANVISYLSATAIPKAPAVAFRQPTAGPELDIVHRYCQDHLASIRGECELSIFLEPKLDSGFPDIVAVFWDRGIAQQWPQERANLLSMDMPIIHHVNVTGTLPVGMLVKRFGARKASNLMLRLSDAHVADVMSDEIRRKPLQDTFAIKKIVAIEAKVKDWRKGLEQAFQNTWFASESYLLLGVLPQSSNLTECAEKLGVGVLHKEQSLLKPQLKSRVGKLPTSHASWLFNEWAWKYADL